MNEDTATLPFKVAGIEFQVHNVPVSWRNGQAVIELGALDAVQALIALRLIDGGVRDGDAVRLLRKVARMKGAELAAYVNVRAETVSSWENGHSTIGLAEWFMLSAKVLDRLSRPIVPDRIQAAVKSPTPMAPRQELALGAI